MTEIREAVARVVHKEKIAFMDKYWNDNLKRSNRGWDDFVVLIRKEFNMTADMAERIVDLWYHGEWVT